MKRIFLIIIIVSSIISCNTSKEEKETHSENHDEHAHGENEEGHNNEAHLTIEQIKLAGIKTGAITKQMIKDELALIGEIQVPPQSKATVYAPIEAFVEKATLLPGEKVVKGQIIATLKHPKFIEMQQQFLEANIELSTNTANYDRKKSLLEKDIISRKSFQAIESKYLTSKSLVDSYGSQLEILGFNPSIIKSKGVQKLLYVTAPITGYITINNLNKGKFVSSNELMYEIINNDHMHVELQVFATDLNKIKKGSPILFNVKGVKKEYQGEVELIGTKIKEETKTADIHGHFEDPDKVIKPGMYVEARILSSTAREGYTVPETAIIEQEGEYYLFTPKSNVEFIRLKIIKGKTQGGKTEIKNIEGNNYSVPIITEGAYYLKGALLQSSGEMGGHNH